MKLIHGLTRTLGYLAIAGSLVLGVLFFMTAHQRSMLGFHSQSLSNLLGAGAVAAAIAAVGIWIMRKVYVEIKKRKIPDFELTRMTLLFLREHHILLGWTTLVVAAAHGMYYLLRYPGKRLEVYTGLATWSILAVLVAIGTILNYQIKERQRAKGIRKLHFVIAIVFICGMFIHIL